MTEPVLQHQRDRYLGPAAPFVLAILVLIGFRNVPHNVFELDDWHSITQNPSIRSLANIPQFFTDATTSSILRQNQDYRPLLLTTYAINYAISGYNEDRDGVDAWHLTNILIHFGVCWCIFLIGRRLFGTIAIAPVPGLNPRIGDAASLTAAAFFAIHPIASGPVNYICARSSTLTALFVLLAILFYLRGLARPKRWWRFLVSGVFFTLGMLTKVEAVSFLAAAAMAELLLDPVARAMPALRRPARRVLLFRLAPMIVVAGAILFIWYHQTGLRTSETRAGLDVTSKDYLVTQFRAWWYYIGQIVAPFNLIFDYPSYPRSRWNDFFAFRGDGFLVFKDPKAVLAFLGWAVVGVGAALLWRRVPVVTFLVGCFFACLAPHSSIVPLAEPVNEHRPYLPDASVFLLMAIGLGLFASRNLKRPRLAFAVLFAALALPLAGITRERNALWKSSIALLTDAVAKAPDSARVQMNLGVALMKEQRNTEAEARFREALRLAPAYTYAYSNLGIVLMLRGEAAEAKAAHDSAVRIAPDTDAVYLWRGRFFAALRNIPAAAADFVKGTQLNARDLRLQAGAAETLLRLGRVTEAESHIKQGEALDPSNNHASFKAERAAIAAMMGPADADAQEAEGARYRAKGQWMLAEWCYREAVRLDPSHAVSHVNLGIVLSSQGLHDVAVQWYDRAVELQPQSDMPVYWRGRYRASRGLWDGALADFNAALQLGGGKLRDRAAIIEVLAASKRKDEANAMISGADPAQAAELERERAAFRAQVFKAR